METTLITGASVDIGEAIAKRLAEKKENFFEFGHFNLAQQKLDLLFVQITKLQHKIYKRFHHSKIANSVGHPFSI